MGQGRTRPGSTSTHVLASSPMRVHLSVATSPSMGLDKRSFSPSISGHGWEVQNPHDLHPLLHQLFCVYNVNGSLSCAVDTGNMHLLWPGLELLSLSTSIV